MVLAVPLDAVTLLTVSVKLTVEPTLRVMLPSEIVPRVSVIAEAPLLSVVPEKLGVVVALLTVTVPPPKVSAVEPNVEPLRVRPPLLTVVEPVKISAPAIVSVPVPTFTNEPVPLIEPL